MTRGMQWRRSVPARPRDWVFIHDRTLDLYGFARCTVQWLGDHGEVIANTQGRKRLDNDEYAVGQIMTAYGSTEPVVFEWDSVTLEMAGRHVHRALQAAQAGTLSDGELTSLLTDTEGLKLLLDDLQVEVLNRLMAGVEHVV